MSKLVEGVTVREATHVKVGGCIEKIVSKWGINPLKKGQVYGGFAKPSAGGFGVVTESGRRVGMWDVQFYLKEKEN